jgi:hypothetical protein
MAAWPSPLDIYLFHNCREELLNTEDITVVEERENTGRISAVVSPSSHRSKSVQSQKSKKNCDIRVLAKFYFPRA